jgi:hypothetical protein
MTLLGFQEIQGQMVQLTLDWIGVKLRSPPSDVREDKSRAWSQKSKQWTAQSFRDKP